MSRRPPTFAGQLIGAAFGLVFVVADSGAMGYGASRRTLRGPAALA